MPDNFFIDSNVALYALDSNPSKKQQAAFSLINDIPVISPQVIFECLNVCIRKLKYDKGTALEFIRSLLSASFIQPETEEVVTSALALYNKYNLQVFDSKTAASALQAGCGILYSEDMQHGLVIENKLTIINPFLQ